MRAPVARIERIATGDRMNNKYAQFHRIVVSAVLIFLLGCENAPPEFNTVILNRNPNPTVPLAAILTLTTNEPTQVVVRLDDGERTWDVTASDVLATEHALTILGMRPGRIHHITAVATDAEGAVSESPALPLEMPPLPADLPVPELVTADPERMEPGVTIFNAFAMDDEGRGIDDFGGVLYILDERGEVIWYFYNQKEVGDARRLRNGNLLVESNRTNSLIELDMLGNVMSHWHPTGTDMGEPPEDSMPIATDTLHHEVYEMPSENLLSLSTELRIIDDFPTSAEDPDAETGPSAVIGDVIVEFERDGTIVHEHRLLDILDPYRITRASMNPGFWPDHYEPKVDDLEATPLRDVAHANAIIYDDRDDSYIVSVRRQNAVIKVARTTGELKWILGTPEHWKEPWSAKRLQPIGNLEWQFGQHGSVFTGDRNILLYDNGGSRAGAFMEEMPLEDRYSRVVEFAVDEQAMTVEQVWSYDGRPDNSFYSSFVSDADWLPVTGNVLITDGARRTNDDGVNAERGEATNYWARIVEVTHTEPAEVVFEVHLKKGGVGNWHIYRGERLSSLYP